MLHTFDCSCALRLRSEDADALARLATSLDRLGDERDGVLRALFARGEAEGDRLDLVLSTADVASARRLAREIVAEIETHLRVRLGEDAVQAGALHIRTSAEVAPALPFERPSGEPCDGFEQRLGAGHRAYASPRGAAIADPERALTEAGTSGPGGQPTTAEVLAKLDEWRVLVPAGFDVVEVGPHHLTLRFAGLPRQLQTFAEDVLLFCPQVTDEVDILEEIVDAPAELVAHVAVNGIADLLRDGGTLRLWWD